MEPGQLGVCKRGFAEDNFLSNIKCTTENTNWELSGKLQPFKKVSILKGLGIVDTSPTPTPSFPDFHYTFDIEEKHKKMRREYSSFVLVPSHLVQISENGIVEPLFAASVPTDGSMNTVQSTLSESTSQGGNNNKSNNKRQGPNKEAVYF